MYFEQHELLNGASSKKRIDHKGGTVTVFLDELARAWEKKPASMGQLSSLAKNSGRAWANLQPILDGKYKEFGTKKLGAAPTAIWHFLMLGNIPEDVTAELFAQVVNGLLPMKKLPEACTRWKATHSLQMYIFKTAQAARSMKDLSTWDKLAKVVPALVGSLRSRSSMTSSSRPPPSRGPSSRSARRSGY